MTFRERLRAAMTAFQDPERVRPPLPDPDMGLPPHLTARPVYEHWHPAGRSLLGFLHVTRDRHQVVGFTPAGDGYGIPMHARSLQQVFDQGPAAAPVSTWRHRVRGGTYGLLGRATVQASTRPLQDGDEVLIYDGDGGRLWVRLPDEFHDGRFEPVNALARGIKETHD